MGMYGCVFVKFVYVCHLCVVMEERVVLLLIAIEQRALQWQFKYQCS